MCRRCRIDHADEKPCAVIDLVRASQDLLLSDVDLVFLDVETTGFSPARDRIVEVSMRKLRCAQTIGILEALINPGRPIPAAATAVHGIDMFAVMNKPSFRQHVDDILAFLDDQCVVVGHNVDFDLGFLNHEIARAGRLNEQWMGLSFCTLRIARRRHSFENNKLGFLAQKLGVTVEHAHRAGADVLTTIGVFDALVRDLSAHSDAGVRSLLAAQGGFFPAPLSGTPKFR